MAWQERRMAFESDGRKEEDGEVVAVGKGMRGRRVESVVLVPFDERGRRLYRRARVHF